MSNYNQFPICEPCQIIRFIYPANRVTCHVSVGDHACKVVLLWYGIGEYIPLRGNTVTRLQKEVPALIYLIILWVLVGGVIRGGGLG